MTEPESRNPKPPLVPPAYFLFCLIGGVALHVVFPIPRIIIGPYRLIGVLPLLLSGGIAIWANQTLTRCGTTIKPHREPSVMVTTGPFRFSRNPMYLSLAMVLTAVAIALGSLVTFAAPIAFALLINTTFIPYEERKMERIFGAQFTAYKGRVRAWL